MYARLSRFAGLAPERLDDLIEHYESYAPGLEETPGFQGTIFAVDRDSGKATAISFWDTRENMERSEEAAEVARLERARRGGPARDPIVDRYEVVLDQLPQASDGS